MEPGRENNDGVQDKSRYWTPSAAGKRRAAAMAILGSQQSQRRSDRRCFDCRRDDCRRRYGLLAGGACDADWFARRTEADHLRQRNAGCASETGSARAT